jgi:hypothetical protein
MMPSKKVVTFIVFVLSSFCLTLQAQPRLNYIPANAKIIATIDGKNIFSKVNMEEVKQMEMYKMLEEKWLTNSKESGGGMERVLPALFLKGETYGLDLNARSYFYNYQSDTLNFGCYVTGLTDKQKFVSAMTDAFGSDGMPDMVNKGHYVYIPTSDMALAIVKDAIVFYFPIQRSYSYFDYEEKEMYEEEEGYYESYEDQIKERDKRRKEEKRRKMESGLDYIFNLDKSASIIIDGDFIASQEQDFDMSMFLKTTLPGYVGNEFPIYEMEEFMGPDYADKLNKLQELYADNYTVSYLNFKQGKVSIDSKIHVNDQFYPHIKAVNNAKIDTKLARYIKKDALGIAGMAVNPEALGPAFKATFFPIYETLPRYGGSITSVLDIMGTLIDEKEVYDLIGGDALFAVTAIKEFDISYTTYDYDDDYNRTKVTETKKEVLPEFVFLASAGNEKLMDKIFTLMEKTRAVVKKGDYYKVMDTGWKSFDVFLAHVNGAFIVTNDEELITKHLKTGYPKNEQLGGEQLKMLKKHNYYASWEIRNTLEHLPKETLMMSRKEKEMLEQLSKAFTSVQLTGLNEVGKHFDQEMVLYLEDGTQNSLDQIIALFNTFFRIDQQ